MRKFFIFLTIITCVLSSSVFAMTPTYTNDAKFSRSVGNCCYYVDSAASGYTNQINDAAYNWENTGYGWNPIYMTAVSSNYATHIDFYAATPATNVYLNSSVAAFTSFWNSNSAVIVTPPNAPSYNYFYTEIMFNTSNTGSYDYRTSKHEMGHALGLNHYANHYSIMYPSLDGMYVTTVQQCDHDTINYLYN